MTFIHSFSLECLNFKVKLIDLWFQWRVNVVNLLFEQLLVLKKLSKHILQSLSVSLFQGNLQTLLWNYWVVGHCLLNLIKTSSYLCYLIFHKSTFWSNFLNGLLNIQCFQLELIDRDLLSLCLQNEPLEGLEAVEGFELILRSCLIATRSMIKAIYCERISGYLIVFAAPKMRDFQFLDVIEGWTSLSVAYQWFIVNHGILNNRYRLVLNAKLFRLFRWRQLWLWARIVVHALSQFFKFLTLLIELFLLIGKELFIKISQAVLK